MTSQVQVSAKDTFSGQNLSFTVLGVNTKTADMGDSGIVTK